MLRTFILLTRSQALILAALVCCITSLAQAAGDAAKGSRLFLMCRACHAVTAQAAPGVGPNLYGVVGAPAGKRPGYDYSPALAGSGLVWTPENLDRWVIEPTALVPGTKMAFAGVASPSARQDLIAYLTSLSPHADAKPFLSLQALRTKYGDPAGHIANLLGMDVYYKDEGSGPVVLLLHASASSQHGWDGVAERLRATHRVIRYDVPPMGLSGPVSDAVAAHVRPADVAEALLARLGVTRATVVGTSSGGTLAVALAAKRPDLVERLILSNAPSDPVQASRLAVSPALQAEEARAKADGFQSQAFWNAFLDFFSGDPVRMSAATREQFYDFNRRAPEPNQLSLVAKVADHAQAVAAMAAVTAPTLLIWGARDKLLPVAAEESLAAYLSHAKVSAVILPDVGHYPAIEVPGRFAEILEK